MIDNYVARMNISNSLLLHCVGCCLIYGWVSFRYGTQERRGDTMLMLAVCLCFALLVLLLLLLCHACYIACMLPLAIGLINRVTTFRWHN